MAFSLRDALNVVQQFRSTVLGSTQHIPHKIIEKSRMVLEVTPTISTSPAYSDGDCIGGKMTFAGAAYESARGGEIDRVVITDKDKENAPIDLFLFDSDPSASTFTDNAAFTIADADLVKLIGWVEIRSYAEAADNCVGGQNSAGFGYKLATGTDLFGVMVIRGAHTYTSASDLKVRLIGSLG